MSLLFQIKPNNLVRNKNGDPFLKRAAKSLQDSENTIEVLIQSIDLNYHVCSMILFRIERYLNKAHKIYSDETTLK